ncbi:U3-containing 90S pre-ribosomal complex subunit-domain containing protein [Russula ochroleuca]|uniref:U3-containing 90S pre-ribosomal complex subunit-domain containing protein n=1 Tax=Russula ochroleuca TaxID=152965 RepID=A0A9P5MUB9_9AGAM|nr:U3-containing 90S pre-ribosomal complex subunit-domain containing protein [Russula ochroleuca]
MAYHKGDDLEDDFVPDETVALSEDEGFESLVGDQDDIGKLLSADEEEKEDDVESPIERTQAPSEEKKRKRREKEKERKAKERPLQLHRYSRDLTSVALRSPGMISEYLSIMQARSFSKISALELQDRHIPGTSIVDTTTWTGSRNLDTLVDFIVQAVPLLHTRLLQRTKSSGAPTLLFLTGAALRVADVTRVLKNKTLQGEKGAGVAKLFAKHVKLEEHVELLKKTKIGTAVGTPGRVGKLLCDTGKYALSVSALTHVMVDVSFHDAKNRCLLDIPETRDDIFKTVLGAPLVLERLKAGKLHIVLF